MTALIAIVVLGQSCVAQQTYVAPVQYQQQAYNQAYVEKTIFVAVEPQEAQVYYGGLVASQQRQAERQSQAQQATAGTDAKIDQLTRLVLELQKRLETQASEPPLPSHPGQQATNPPLPSLGASSEAVPPPPTVAQASIILSTGTRNGPGHAILSAKCAGCHGKNGTAKGGRRFFDRSGESLQADATALSVMRDAILAGTMPPPSAKLSPLTLREFAAINDLVNQQMGSVALNSNPREKTR